MAATPRDPNFSFLGPIDRRKFLQALTQAAAVLAAGCGSSPEGNPFGSVGADATGSGSVAGAPLPNTKAIAGTVNTTQIGGLGLLVQSAFQLNSPVTTGQFNTRISEVGPQLLFVLDAAGKLRALAISQPNDKSVTLDAHSTAVALVFMTLGILTLDPADAATRLQQIVALPAFIALRTYIAGKLPGTDLGVLSQDAPLLALLDAVRVAFDALAPVAKATVSTGRVDAAFSDAKPPSLSAEVGLSNFAWRFVALRRLELDSAHQPITLPVAPALLDAQSLKLKYNLLSGINTKNWGNIFTLQVNTPGTATDPVDLTQSPHTAFLDYVVIGPGNPFLSVPLPPSLSPEDFAADEALATVTTIVFYWLGPYLDLAAGGLYVKAIPLSKVGELGHSVFSSKLSFLDVMNAIHSNENGKNNANVVSAAINFMVAVVGALGGVIVAAAAGTAAAPFVASAVGVFALSAAVSGFIFAFENLGRAVATLTDAPAVGRFEVSTGNRKRYDIEFLDYPPYAEYYGSIAQSQSINKLGHVAYIGVDNLGASVGLRLRKNGAETVVDANPPNWTAAGINDLGDVFAGNKIYHTVGGGVTTLEGPVAGETVYISGLNRTGQAAGVVVSPDGSQRGFFYNGTLFTVIDAFALSGAVGRIYSITAPNASGMVAGLISTLAGGGGDLRLFTWQGGVLTFIDTGGETLIGNLVSITNAGTILYGVQISDAIQGVRLYLDGQIGKLDPLPGYITCQPFAVNNLGQVLGLSRGQAGVAFEQRVLTLWDAGEANNVGELLRDAPLGEKLQADNGGALSDNDGLILAVLGTRGVLLRPHAG